MKKIFFILIILLFIFNLHADEKKENKIVVAIFSGHTSDTENKGCISASGINEYEYNDNISSFFTFMDTKDIHYEVFFARNNIDVKERPEIAKKIGADILIEIHHDSAHPNTLEKLKNEKTKEAWSEVSGFSVFFSKKHRNEDESRNLATFIGFSMLKHGFYPNKYHNLGVYGWHKEFINPIAGVYMAPYYILENVDIPSVIVECGVIANPFEEENLKTDETKRTIADAIHEAVKLYIKGTTVLRKRKEEKTTATQSSSQKLQQQ